MRRLLCWFLGHDWRVLRVNARKNMNLGHLHPWAGYDSACARCGREWLDAGGWT